MSDHAAQRLVEHLRTHRPGQVVELEAIPTQLEPPSIPTWFVGPPLQSFAALGPTLERRAYAFRFCLTPSEVFAETGDLAVLDLPAPSERREALLLLPRSEHGRLDELPDDLASDRFTLAEYRGLLRGAQAAGYRFLGFDDALTLEDEHPSILLRHDVDLSPRLALRMAEVEAAAGVRSTYFFMISGAFYDVLEPDHRAVVRAVAELGHRVGFHYDELDDIEEGLAILSVIARTRLRHIAQHNPTLLPRRGLAAADIVDAYDPRLTGSQGFRYVSDSGMRWRAQTLADLIGAQAPRIYALCHPESWTTEGRDMLSMIRMVEQAESTRRRQRYDGFVAGNVEYLRARRDREGR